jgi:hypothetical protein
MYQTRSHIVASLPIPMVSSVGGPSFRYEENNFGMYNPYGIAQVSAYPQPNEVYINGGSAMAWASDHPPWGVANVVPQYDLMEPQGYDDNADGLLRKK